MGYVDKSKWNHISISKIIQIENRYEHQQLFDDFSHIKIMHIENNVNANRIPEWNDIARNLCKYFETKFKCHDIMKCNGFLRHHRERTNDEREQLLYFEKSQFPMEQEQKICIEDAAFQQECDKMHCYFFHSTIKFGAV